MRKKIISIITAENGKAAVIVLSHRAAQFLFLLSLRHRIFRMEAMNTRLWYGTDWKKWCRAREYILIM